MLYTILKLPARIAFWFYIKNLRLNKKGPLALKGPLILACNHPNSFLDAIILCTLFKQPIYSLARGDVFKKKWLVPFLKGVNIYPVYRTREGAENLDLNYATFAACQEIFKKNGIVLIFSEGLCENEWHLRPLKKGTARLVMNAWNAGIPLRILPVGLNYSSFRYFGKNLIVNFGRLIEKKDIDLSVSEGRSILNFNKELNDQLQELVYEIDSNDTKAIKRTFSFDESALKSTALLLPALIGYILCWPLYTPIKYLTERRFKNSGHYDSIMVAMLFMLFPLYAVLLCTIMYFWLGWAFALLIFYILLFCSWSLLQVRKVV